MKTITNRTFDEITVGDHCERTHTVTGQDLLLFATVSGDMNPLHLDADYAATTPFKGQIAHGMFTGALISAALAMELPGPGTVYLDQNLAFRRAVKLGDTVTVHLTVTDKQERKSVVTIKCEVKNQNGKTVADGEASVMAPTSKMTIEVPDIPQVTVHQ